MDLLNLSLLAQGGEPEISGGAAVVVLVFYLALLITVVAGGWKMFAKAGEPGWGILIPFFNLYLLTKIAGRPAWWLILLLIPFVSMIFIIIVMIDIAKAFGRDVGTGLGLTFLPFIFYPILGFGSAQYQRTA